MKKNILSKIKISPFSVNYAQSKGVSNRMLIHYASKGTLIRLSQGMYAFPDSLTFDFEGLTKEKLAQAPQGILGMNSALKMYGLTEDDLAEIEIMVPESNVPKKKMEDVKFYSVADHLFKEGISKVRGIKVTTIERTIVDILKRKGLAKDVREIIIKAQQKKIKINFSELKRLVLLFRVHSKFKSIIENL